MCTYYFHVRYDVGLARDEEGVDLPDLRSALTEAMQSAREYVADGSPTLKNASFEISDDTGRMVLRVAIQEIRSQP